jgi:hypothetical protein
MNYAELVDIRVLVSAILLRMRVLNSNWRRTEDLE